MIKIDGLEGFEIKGWKIDTETDQEAQTWIWNQLMGETVKGDRLDFSIIKRGDEEIFAGVLRDRNDRVKGVVPAIYELFKDGVLDLIEWTGKTRHDDMDSLESDLIIGRTDVDIEEIGRRFLFETSNVQSSEQ